jgi:hypothetical protein
MDADSRRTASGLRQRKRIFTVTLENAHFGSAPELARRRTPWNLDCSSEFVLADSFAACAKRHSGSAALEVLGETFMAWLVRTLRLPAAESHTNLALALCVFLMGLLSVALIWQAQIIANQRDAIRFLETLKFGS